jgi:hypothetical protein
MIELSNAVNAVTFALRAQGRADRADAIDLAFAQARDGDDARAWARLKGLVSAGMGSLWDTELFPTDPVAEERFRDNLEVVYEVAKVRAEVGEAS